jgi:Histidinol dehydrogenase
MRVTPEEIKEAYFHIRKDEGDALRFAAQRITAFHERQRLKTWMYQDHEATLGQWSRRSMRLGCMCRVVRPSIPRRS